MQSLGAKEAADAIRETIVNDHLQRVDPEQAHQLKYLSEVCSHLGLEASADNVHHVAAVLRHHDIELHSGNQYPKWVGEGTAAKIVNSEAEEHDFFNPPAAPEPATVDSGPDEAESGSSPDLVGRDQVHIEELSEPVTADSKTPKKRPI